MVVQPSHDAWHPHNDRYYVEWWYLDLVADDGSLVRGQLFVAGDISRPKKVVTGVRASYVKSDGTEIHVERRFPFASLCDVRIGPNFIVGDLSHYRVHIEDADSALDLELDSSIKGTVSHACFGDEARYMYWVVPQPRCRARGAIRARGETFPVEGIGYRDHNWLNFAPIDVLSYWDWGIVYDDEYTIIFADIVTTPRMNGDEVKPIMIYDADKLVYLTTEKTKWSLAKSDISLDPVNRVGVAHRNVLRANDEGLSLEVELDLQRVFQRIDLLADFNPVIRFLVRTFKAKPTITSFFSRGSGRLSCNGRQKTLNCRAVHELVKNR